MEKGEVEEMALSYGPKQLKSINPNKVLAPSNVMETFLHLQAKTILDSIKSTMVFYVVGLKNLSVIYSKRD